MQKFLSSLMLKEAVSYKSYKKQPLQKLGNKETFAYHSTIFKSHNKLFKKKDSNFYRFRNFYPIFLMGPKFPKRLFLINGFLIKKKRVGPNSVNSYPILMFEGSIWGIGGVLNSFLALKMLICQ